MAAESKGGVFWIIWSRVGPTVLSSGRNPRLSDDYALGATHDPERSIDHVTYFDTSARILGHEAAHQAGDHGACVMDRSDLVPFDGHPKDCPNVVYEDVWVLGRRPILHGETGSTKFTRKSFGALGWTFIEDTYSHLYTVKVVGDSCGAKERSFLRVLSLKADVGTRAADRRDQEARRGAAPSPVTFPTGATLEPRWSLRPHASPHGRSGAEVEP
jgi:hypothetical protein